MRRTFAMSAAVILSVTLVACGQTSNETHAGNVPVTQSVVPGIVYAESPTQRLFTAQRADGFLDFKLYYEHRQSGQITLLDLPIPENALVIGAALLDNATAFVATRTPTPQGDLDALYILNLQTGASTLLAQSKPGHFAGIEINSLTVQDGTSRFFALRPVTLPDGRLESELSLFRLDANTRHPVAVDENTAEAAQFRAALAAAAERDLAARRITVQAATPFLRFPKSLASRNVPGSPFHTGQDLYAVDLNRDSGDMDLGDGVVAAAAGQVTQSANVGSGYGEYITIRHANGLTTAYAHLDKRAVATGVNVYQGQYIGNVGKSGGQTYAHLHFVLRNGTTPLRVASTTYPMAASYSGAACPLTSFPDEINVSPASC